MSFEPLRILFDLRRPVSRLEYAVATCFLLAAWHGVAWMAYQVIPQMHGEWTVLNTFEYLLTARERLDEASSFAGFFRYLPFIGVPFRWLLFSLSARRAHQAGLDPLLAVVTVVPIVGDVASLIVAALPPKDDRPIASWRGGNAGLLQLILLFCFSLFAMSVVVGLSTALAPHQLPLDRPVPALRLAAAVVAFLPFAIACAAYRGGVVSGDRGERAIHTGVILGLGAFGATLAAVAPGVCALFLTLPFYFGWLAYACAVLGVAFASMVALLAFSEPRARRFR